MKLHKLVKVKSGRERVSSSFLSLFFSWKIIHLEPLNFRANSTTFEFSNFVPLTDGFSFFWNDRASIVTFYFLSRKKKIASLLLPGIITVPGWILVWSDRERIRHHRCALPSFLSFSLVQWIFLAVREVSIRIGKKGKEGSINRADWGEKGSFPRGEGVFDSHVSFPSTSFFIHRSVVVFEPALLRSSNVRVNANCFKRLISISNLWEM